MMNPYIFGLQLQAVAKPMAYTNLRQHGGRGGGGSGGGVNRHHRGGVEELTTDAVSAATAAATANPTYMWHLQHNMVDIYIALKRKSMFFSVAAATTAASRGQASA